MKGLITTLFIMISCEMVVLAQSVTEKTQTDFHSLSWLVGKWNRVNITRAGRTAFEVWKKSGEFELTGLGVTLQDNDTLFVEKLKIALVGNKIHYIADVPENPNPVHFTFTVLSTHEFSCENPGHDYPKKITYQLNGNTLRAQTSGNGKSQDFIFEKIRK